MLSLEITICWETIDALIVYENKIWLLVLVKGPKFISNYLSYNITCFELIYYYFMYIYSVYISMPIIKQYIFTQMKWIIFWCREMNFYMIDWIKSLITSHSTVRNKYLGSYQLQLQVYFTSCASKVFDKYPKREKQLLRLKDLIPNDSQITRTLQI